jgi:hypothetical protein
VGDHHDDEDELAMILRGRTLDLGIATLAAAQLGAAAWLVPVGDQVVTPSGGSLGGLCLFRALFHTDCPFCGMTRSFVALAHGDLAAAFRFHPAGPILFLALAVFLGAALVVWVRRQRPLVERRQVRFALEAVALTCLAIGIFKMVRS